MGVGREEQEGACADGIGPCAQTSPGRAVWAGGQSVCRPSQPTQTNAATTPTANANFASL